MIKYYCDKCKKEIECDDVIVVKFDEKCLWKMEQDLLDCSFHLCRKCAEKIIKNID